MRAMMHYHESKAETRYFDRLELAAAYTSNPVENITSRQLDKASLKGLL